MSPRSGENRNDSRKLGKRKAKEEERENDEASVRQNRGQQRRDHVHVSHSENNSISDKNHDIGLFPCNCSRVFAMARSRIGHPNYHMQQERDIFAHCQQAYNVPFPDIARPNANLGAYWALGLTRFEGVPGSSGGTFLSGENLRDSGHSASSVASATNGANNDNNSNVGQETGEEESDEELDLTINLLSSQTRPTSNI